MRTSPNGKDTTGTQRVRWVDCLDIWVKEDGTRFWMPNERKFVLSRNVFSRSEVVWNSRNNINQNEGMCPTRHVAPTEEIEVLQTYKIDDGNTASIPGGSNSSNLEIRVKGYKSILKRKFPIRWIMTNSFAFLVIGSDATVWSHFRPLKRCSQTNSSGWKVVNVELASVKENETWELVDRPDTAKVVQNRWVMRVNTSRDGKARFKARLVTKGYTHKQGLVIIYLVP